MKRYPFIVVIGTTLDESPVIARVNGLQDGPFIPYRIARGVVGKVEIV